MDEICILNIVNQIECNKKLNINEKSFSDNNQKKLISLGGNFLC